MSTTPDDHQITMIRDQQHRDYLRCLLSMNHEQARQASSLVEEASFCDNWQAAKIHAAIIKTVEAGGNEALLASDVNAVLVASGELNNPSLHGYWLSLVSPQDPRPLAAHRARELAKLINETAFRELYHRIHSSSNLFTTMARPLGDLVELIADNIDQLRQAHTKFIARPTLTTVKPEEGAA